MVDRPLTVAHVDSEMGFSGGEVQVFLLIEGLRRRGHHSVLFCPAGSRCETEARSRGIEVRGVRMRNYLDLMSISSLRRGFREIGADIVQLNTGRDTWLGGWAAHREGLPAITTRRMDRHVKPGRRTRLIYKRLTQRVVAISPGVVDCLREGGVPDETIVHIWEAVDPERITPRRGRDDGRRDLGVAPGEVLLLGVGVLSPRKGFDVLLEAVRLLDPAEREVLVVRVAGGGAELERLEAQARSLGLAERVRFLGRREDMADLLCAADVFVLPSRREGLGVAALEAMGAGRPVIASRVGGLAQSVIDGETGLHVPPGEPRPLAEAIRRLLRDADLRRRLGEAGPKRIAGGFQPEQMVSAYERLYREILAERAQEA